MCACLILFYGYVYCIATIFVFWQQWFKSSYGHWLKLSYLFFAMFLNRLILTNGYKGGHKFRFVRSKFLFNPQNANSFRTFHHSRWTVWKNVFLFFSQKCRESFSLENYPDARYKFSRREIERDFNFSCQTAFLFIYFYKLPFQSSNLLMQNVHYMHEL